MNFIQFVDGLLSILTLTSHIVLGFILLGLLASLFVPALATLRRRSFGFLAQRGYLIVFIVSLVATSGSLFYSEVAGYEPCRLCWFQRIAMYPLVIISGLSLRGPTWEKIRPVLPLAVIGALIAAYHYWIQISALFDPHYSDTCAATGVSCVTSHFFDYGYISIPLMSFTAFVLILAGVMMFHRVHGAHSH